MKSKIQFDLDQDDKPIIKMQTIESDKYTDDMRDKIATKMGKSLLYNERYGVALVYRDFLKDANKDLIGSEFIISPFTSNGYRNFIYHLKDEDFKCLYDHVLTDKSRREGDSTK